MIRKKRSSPEAMKLDLTPMMDAIFIFIFFLLFSSESMRLFEIETDTPLVREVPQQEKLKKDPLNLIINIDDEKIIIRTGLDRTEYKKYDKHNENIHNILKEDLLKIRKEYPDDNYVILSPSKNIPYEEIVTLIDTIQTLPKGMNELHLPNAEKEKTFNKIYSQVVLEPLNEDT